MSRAAEGLAGPPFLLVAQLAQHGSDVHQAYERLWADISNLLGGRFDHQK